MTAAMVTAHFLPFLLTALLIELTPGPNMAWLALTGATAGRKAALAATAGIAVGLLLIALASAFGLAGLIQTSPNLLTLLRYCGAAYLLWLAWSAWVGEAEVSPGQTQFKDARQWFRHGVFLNLLNPKAAIFFVAILPNYVAVGPPVMPQTLLLSICYVAIATMVHLALALLAGQTQTWFRKNGNAMIIRRTCAVLMAGVALWFLATTVS